MNLRFPCANVQCFLILGLLAAVTINAEECRIEGNYYFLPDTDKAKPIEGSRVARNDINVEMVKEHEISIHHDNNPFVLSGMQGKEECVFWLLRTDVNRVLELDIIEFRVGDPQLDGSVGLGWPDTIGRWCGRGSALSLRETSTAGNESISSEKRHGPYCGYPESIIDGRVELRNELSPRIRWVSNGNVVKLEYIRGSNRRKQNQKEGFRIQVKSVLPITACNEKAARFIGEALQAPDTGAARTLTHPPLATPQRKDVAVHMQCRWRITATSGRRFAVGLKSNINQTMFLLADEDNNNINYMGPKCCLRIVNEAQGRSCNCSSADLDFSTNGSAITIFFESRYTLSTQEKFFKLSYRTEEVTKRRRDDKTGALTTEQDYYLIETVVPTINLSTEPKYLTANESRSSTRRIEPVCITILMLLILHQ